LEALYRQEGARLFAVTRRLVRDPALAEDIVQEAFIRIWTRAGSFDPARGSARGWIYSLTRHLALNHLRDHAREVLIDAQTDVALEVAGDAEAGDGPVHPGKLHECLQKLPAERRRCLLHAYLDGYSQAEIASRLATPLGTVKAWIKRSLAALRECLQ